MSAHPMRHRLPALLLLVLMLVVSLVGFGSAGAYSATVGEVNQRNTPTPEPDEIDMEDWQELKGDGVQLMAPPEFEGGSIKDILEMMEAMEGRLGDEMDQIFEIAQANPELYKLFAFDPEPTDAGTTTNLNITGTELPMDLPMESILELLPTSFPSTVDILESEVIELGDYEEVGRLTLELELLNLEQTLTVYVFVLDEVLYAVTFTTSSEDYKDLAPVFEAMATTFEVVEERAGS
jgi:hypothetical protein